ncbi:MAG: carbohydrate-binding domain-containing protein [Clostridia bacterium]|nr:carbohydrate-binding domain-containing protein [Clostridia bacterium]
MKKSVALLLAMALLVTLVGCGQTEDTQPSVSDGAMTESLDDTPETYAGTSVVLSDTGITVDGTAISRDSTAAVYAANDIVYYESGKDFTYGEGEENDAHTKAEAEAHTVVHITKAGQYVLSGTLSKGQIAVDLGEDAQKDPNAVVTLVLNGMDITCSVAPAVIFYNVYECGSKNESTATKDVDTTAAGARVIVANNSQNKVDGSYVARIYKPGTVQLNEDGTEVEDAEKLHKYDAAFYSKMSMTVQGGNKGNGNGSLQIQAANEGLDSELHLTINGGVIQIESGNDGINTNEDNISVTTINGGVLNIVVNGATGEGDGIDSNGWLVINGGTVVAQACSFSGDAGIDSDKGIHINGGTVVAGGHMLDRIEDGGQTFAVFTMSRSRKNSFIQLKNTAGETVLSQSIANDYSILVISSPNLIPGEYTLWDGEIQLEGSNGQGGGMRPGGVPEGQPPEGMEPPQGEDGQRPTRPEGMEPPQGEDGQRPTRPEGMEPPQGEDGQRPTRPEGMEPPQGEDGQRPGGNSASDSGEVSAVFTISQGANYFQIS